MAKTREKETRELNQNELASVSGGSDPLHLLAQVNHLASQDAGVKLADVAAAQKRTIWEKS